MYTNTLFIGQSYMKRRNGEKEKKNKRRLYDYRGGTVEGKDRERKRKERKGGERQMPS
jgi:3-deoxy-D-arabino-heptulosonate 7-phosphate (DAHP) synthase class II